LRAIHGGSNSIVVTHDYCTPGSHHKYDPASGAPAFPAGFAEPDRNLSIQEKAEIMAGRGPLSPQEAQMPASLSAVVVGPATATEIRMDAPVLPPHDCKRKIQRQRLQHASWSRI